MSTEHAAAPRIPISLFPVTQERVRACLEAADDAALAGQDRLRDQLVAQARSEVESLRAEIVGLAA